MKIVGIANHREALGTGGKQAIERAVIGSQAEVRD
jgi:hypothetical protein